MVMQVSGHAVLGEALEARCKDAGSRQRLCTLPAHQEPMVHTPFSLLGVWSLSRPRFVGATVESGGFR